MPISRERAADLSQRIVDQWAKVPGASFGAPREVVRNRVLRVLLEWDKESEKLEAEARARVLTRGRRVTEGSREFDILFAEEMTRGFEALVGRGE